MDKAQALDKFWNGFGLNAYEANSVESKTPMPYITYEVVTDSFENQVSMSGDLWFYSESWKDISILADAISQFIGIAGILVPLDRGYAWIKRGSPFAQHVADPDDMIRRIRIGIQVEFLTDV